VGEVLNTNVLVLNKNYSPIWITNAKRAFSMLFRKQAEVIHVENESYINYDFKSWAEVSELKRELEEYGPLDDWVFTPNLILQVPRVIRSISYDRVPNRKVRLSRRNIIQRDNLHCQYCNKEFNTKDLNIDHVIPSSRGGKSIWTNLVTSCTWCNSKKGNRTPEEANMKLKRKPLRPNFLPFIKINVRSKKYASWKSFISSAYWDAELVG